MHAPDPPASPIRLCARRVGSWLREWPARAAARAGRVGVAGEGRVAFRCNLCGRENRVQPSAIGREIRSCAGCGSTVRFRALGQLVVRETLGRDEALCDIARAPEIRGLGLSDAEACAKPLRCKFAYENTYLHRSPRLDILDVPATRLGRYDFVIASDVFEHVAPPVAKAFENARALLAPGGILIFTVPFTFGAQTDEHYPDLHDWHLEARDGRWRVLNTTRDGRAQVFEEPVFHGGAGTTLEMRVFARDALLREFTDAGFARVRVADEDSDAFGIAWREPQSVPIVAYA